MRRPSLLLLAVFVSGCAGPDTPEGVTISDSASVVIVANGESQIVAAEQWHLGATPSQWIQSRDGEAHLYEVTAVTRTETGLIAAVNRGTDEILLFDTEGGFRGKRGGEGDGPGEFRWLSSVLALGGDSIGAYDFSHKRLSVFAPDGRLAREFTLEGVEGDYETLFVFPGSALAVFTSQGMRGGTLGVFRSLSESFLIDRSGVRLSSFGSFPGAELFIARMAGFVLFGARTYAAVVGDQLVVGTAKEPELRFYGRDGLLRRIVRWPDHDRRVTPERVEQFIQVALASLPEAARAQGRQIFEDVPRSEMQPAYEDVLASSEGRLWVGAYRGPESTLDGARSPEREWLVLDSHGVVEARIFTPLGFQPLFVGEDEVIGVYVDELGVESIQVYRVLREPDGGNGL